MSSGLTRLVQDCIFCKIIRSELPSFRLLETECSYAFLDINPLSKGHSLIIPKYHSEKLDGLPDEYLTDTLPLAKKIAVALGAENYNILQNNGAIAHQVVNHVHFHVIPKPSASDDAGLVIGWPAKETNKDELKTFWEALKGKL